MELLFELGLEEMPSSLIEKASSDLVNLFIDEFSKNRIDYEFIKAYSTPRRLGVKFSLSENQKDLNLEKIGPREDIAFENGSLTKAGYKFLEMISEDIKDLNYFVEQTDKGRYIKATKFLKGVKTEQILQTLIPQVLNRMTFDRNMKWGQSSFRFIRPIKWILAMFNNQVVPFVFENVASSNITRGMRYFGSQNIEITDSKYYEQELLKNYVVADVKKREEMILTSIKDNCNTENETVEIVKPLLDEVKNLVEYPYAIKGEFNKNYLELPEEIITITMETHQRYFTVKTKDNKLTNRFVLIRNSNSYSELVKKGNEKVIEPRLADAKFFYDEDLKRPLIDNLEKMKKVMFQKDMGSMYDKIQRMLKIGQYLSEILKLSNEQKENIKQTILLSKLDLVSNVISEKEFTKLQGYMGSIYAHHQGYSKEIYEGIKEHYKPISEKDELYTISGKITSLADKIDTTVGCISVNVISTSSKDPFAIRRALVGISLVLKDLQIDVDYQEIFKKAFEIFSEDKKVLNKDVLETIYKLFEDRLISVFDKENKQNYIRNILPNQKNIKKIIEINKKITDNNIFELAQQTIKRVNNLTQNLEKTNLQMSDLDEKDMQIFNLIDTDVLSSDKLEKINEYFDSVRVSESNSRIALAHKLNDYLNTILKV